MGCACRGTDLETWCSKVGCESIAHHNIHVRLGVQRSLAGNELREYVEQLGLTQEQLTTLTGIYERSVARCQCGAAS